MKKISGIKYFLITNKNIFIIILISLTISFLFYTYSIYDFIKNSKYVSEISIKISMLENNIDSLLNINVFRVSPKGNIFIIKYDKNKWVSDNNGYITKLWISLPENKLDKIKNVIVFINKNKYIFVKNEIINNWNVISNDKLIYRTFNKSYFQNNILDKIKNKDDYDFIFSSFVKDDQNYLIKNNLTTIDKENISRIFSSIDNLDFKGKIYEVPKYVRDKNAIFNELKNIINWPGEFNIALFSIYIGIVTFFLIFIFIVIMKNIFINKLEKNIDLSNKESVNYFEFNNYFSLPYEKNRVDVSFMWTIGFISILIFFLICNSNIVFGSIKGKWYYSYIESQFPLWICIISIIILTIASVISIKTILKYTKTTLLLLFFIGVLLQILINSVYPILIEDIVVSDTSNSFYSAAMQYSPYDILNNFIQIAPTLKSHASTNMPGKTLFFQFLNLFTESPKIMAYLIILTSSIGAFFMYGICKILFNNKMTGLFAFILYILLPCKIYNFPLLNTITPLFILIPMYLFCLYLEKKNIFIACLLGVSLYFLLIFEPSPFITGLIFLGILIYQIIQKKVTIIQLINMVALTLFGFIITFLIFYFIFSFNIFSVLQYILNDAVNFNERAGRGYLIWIGENIKEFFINTGVPSMIIFVYLISNIFSNLFSVLKKSNIFIYENVITLCLLLTLIIVNLLGINRGEITRLWIYLAVLFQIPVAVYCQKSGSYRIFIFICLLTALQSIITLNHVAFNIP